MAFATDWEVLLDKKYPSYKIEINVFLDSLDITYSVEVSIETIYEAIRFDRSVNENLKALYRKAIHGTNKDVKQRIRSRVSNFKRSLK